MKTAARNVARIAVALAAVGVIAILNGCGAAPDGSSENVEATAEAISYPESQCTWIAGNTHGGNLQVRGPASVNDPNPNVVAFRSAISSIVPGRSTYQVTSLGAGSWYGYDVTGGDPQAITDLVNQYASVTPVFSGYYYCSYVWADYQGTHMARPAVIAVYDPKGCTGCM